MDIVVDSSASGTVVLLVTANELVHYTVTPATCSNPLFALGIFWL